MALKNLADTRVPAIPSANDVTGSLRDPRAGGIVRQIAIDLVNELFRIAITHDLFRLAKEPKDLIGPFVKHEGFARRHDEAIEECRKTIDLHPDFGVAHWYLGRAYLQQGRHGEALAELEKAVTLSGGSPLMKGTLGVGYALAGDRAGHEHPRSRAI